ncbi:EI24 domain-containing protein [Ramlibacter sp. USB13]|uniref:EI24 domain-containing protein n=1 Tax=Ramlibacter cellulosilyticus TaxID=2764187 RepID=A0A923SCE5_9BURK|nr:EI24 domain-containing protein [Ramlibacter cellulosilyticus]MBC5784886.1 EI24 domain-containing protein [Ramlibacter cellulosilyticus]
MSLFLDSFWRAVAYCLHPRVIGLSLLPLIALVLIAGGLSYFFWDSAIDLVFRWLESSAWMESITQWLSDMGMAGLKNALAPLLVIFAVTPLLVIVVLFVVALLMMPAVVKLVSRRRFPELERKHGASFFVGALWSLGSMLLAMVAMVISLPLWLIPPLILVLPPLIWGWLTYRVMTFDSLADHATTEERRLVFREHRMWLLLMGIATGYLGAAPSIVWASGWFFAAAFPILIPVAIWIYTLVFAFSSLWFAHYCLAALAQVRKVPAVVPPPAAEPQLLP